jgi:putative ABC transport system permease protein
VREALASYGTAGRDQGALNLDSGPRWLDLVPRPVLLSLGNTVRRRGRLTLTLTAMICGGAIFIAVLSVRASLLRTLDDVFGYRNYDVQITFTRPYPAAAVLRAARPVAGVVRMEGWMQAIGQRVGATGLAQSDVTLVGPPAGSAFIKPVVLKGRWLRPGDRQAIVVNSDALKDQPDLRPGRSVTFRVEGHSVTWAVVGVVRGVQAGPIAYVTYGSLTHALGQTGLIDRLQAVTQQHDGPFESRVARTLEIRLKHAGFWIDSTQTTVGQRAVLAANFDSIVTFLFAMALLLGLVGGLGLMGTMSIGVLERTRELGIMRAIGASDRAVLLVVMLEGVLIAVLSWIVGAALAVPLSTALSDVVGSAFVNAPLHDTFSPGGAVLWLVGVLVIAALASFVPARRASRLTVRDVLAYE